MSCPDFDSCEKTEEEDSCEKTEEEYEHEQRLIDEMFPNAKFSIAIDYDDLNELVTTRKNIVIKNTYTCYCYDNNPRKTDYFFVKSTSPEGITYRFLIEELIRQDLCLECNHNFVEGFMKSNDSECQFEMVIGS